MDTRFSVEPPGLGLIPGARLELIARRYHLVQLDQPVALATTPHRWLGDIARVR